MRKSTWVMIGIMVAAMSAMMFAANTMLGPRVRDAEVSTLLTRYFQARGDLRPGTKVSALRAAAKPTRLAKSGQGVVVECRPSEAVLAGDGRLAALATAIARLTLEEMGAPTRWVELRFLLGAPNPAREPEPLRTLVALDDQGALADPAPPLPRTWPETAATPLGGAPTASPSPESPK